MYLPLNIKTDYTLLKSMIKIKDLISFAKKNNIKALTITDDNMFGAMEFYNNCISNNIKPIIGLNIKIDSYDVILYAKNKEGYVNLLKISTRYRENILTIELLKELASNLICIIPYESRSLYKNLDNMFSNIYVSYKNEDEKNKINLQNKLYMNPILALSLEDTKYLSFLEAIKENNIVNLEMTDNYLNLDINILSENNYKINEMCDIKIESNNDLMPKFETPNNDSYNFLKEKCKEGLKNIFGDKVNIKYIERLKYEIEVINEMKFNDYFLIVSDYVNFAKNNNILVGPGRGSAVGSLVAYVLGITEIDPIKYDLLFERFLNKNRISMPDIDIDFDGERKDEVIKYCINKYGKTKVAGIITFVTMGSKQILKDLARTLDISAEEIDYLSKLIDSKSTLKDNLKKDIIKNHLTKNQDLKELYEIGIKLEGLKKTISMHASGIVMSNDDLDNFVPLEKHEEMYITGFSMNYLEELGLLKMDFLSIKNLTIISNIVNEVNINLNTIPLDDEETMNIFNKGNTLGIFQFETSGMINLLNKVKPTYFEELCDISALFRPGPSNNINSYIMRKNKKEQIDYFHPNLINILKPTYGILIYQEQIMQIAHVMASYSLGEADILRRAMSKKKEDIIINEKEKFINRSVQNKYELELSTQIYDLILKFAEYGFNKSHSVAYALISYKMAYLKAHYKNNFYKNLLNSVSGSIKTTKDYINDANKNNVKIINPSINKSTDEYIIEDGLIFPLRSIKNISAMLINNILQNRKKQLYLDIFDFLSRVDKKLINSKVLSNLICAGCFDELNINRRTLIENLDVIINYADLLRELGSEYAIKPEIVYYEEFSKKELTKKEFEVFGFYLNNHPINEYRKEYNKPITLSTLSSYLDKVIDVIVCIDSKREIKNKNNEKMCFIDCSDEFSNITGVIFAKAYEIYNNIHEGDIVKITGRIDRRNGKDQIVCNKIETIDN